MLSGHSVAPSAGAPQETLASFAAHVVSVSSSLSKSSGDSGAEKNLNDQAVESEGTRLVRSSRPFTPNTSTTFVSSSESIEISAAATSLEDAFHAIGADTSAPSPSVYVPPTAPGKVTSCSSYCCPAGGCPVHARSTSRVPTSVSAG